MRKSTQGLALLLTTLFASNLAFALDIPDMHLKSEARDATLVTPNNEGVATKDSSLEIFVNTLLGKGIDNKSEKISEE